MPLLRRGALAAVRPTAGTAVLSGGAAVSTCRLGSLGRRKVDITPCAWRAGGDCAEKWSVAVALAGVGGGEPQAPHTQAQSPTHGRLKAGPRTSTPARSFPRSNPSDTRKSPTLPSTPNSAAYIASIGLGGAPAPRLRHETQLFGIPYPVVGAAPAEGAREVHRIRRRIKSRPLSGPGERAGRKDGGTRRSPRARATGGQLQAV